uniref:Tudor domain-containing protein n=1 Tax=Graphocephala atropunctata TaxID=36148 RepID=A0A1B6LT48_9HEMI
MKTEAGSDEDFLFVRKQSESEEDDHKDDWDDAQLIKAYDLSIYKAKRQILNKIQSEMCLTESDIQEVLGDPPTSPSKKRKKNKSIHDSKSTWKVGSACRSIYSEDGEEYEAEIIKMIDGNWCIVRYIGYNNEEEVLLRELTPSFGKNVVQLQMSAAECYNAALEEQPLATEEQNSKEEGEILPQWEHCGESLPEVPKRVPMMYPHHVPPPAPPMLSRVFHGAASAMAGPSMTLPRPEDEGFNAMLQSWYMCGYYTGYYHRNLKDRHT